MRRVLLSIFSAAAIVLAACSDRNDPIGPVELTPDETLAGKKAPAECLSAEQQGLADGIREQIEDLFIGRGGRTPATQQLNNIERKLCEAHYDGALDMAWGFLGLVDDKMPGQFSGDAGDAAALATDIFALVAAAPNPADPAFKIPEGAFGETGGITTFDPADASAEDPIIATTGNNEAAVVIDAPDVFAPGTGPVTVVLARAAESVVTSPGGFIPGFQAFEEGYEVLSSHQPWSEGPGALIALCVVPPIPEGVNLAIGHLHGEAVSLLVPTDPDPQALGYIDCSDVGPFPGEGEVEAFGGVGSAPSWRHLAHWMIEPVARFVAPSPLHANVLGEAGPGLGGRTKSFSLDAPVDARIEVGESVQLSAGPYATWSSDDESVATVDADGLLTGVGPGTATITADFGNDTSVSLVVTVSPTLLTLTIVDPTGDNTGHVDVTRMEMDFDPSTGEYEIRLEADPGSPFVGVFRVNINLLNVDEAAFFSDVGNDFDLADAVTNLTLSGTRSALTTWDQGDFVTTNSLCNLGPDPRFFCSTFEVPNPPGISLFRATVHIGGFLSNEDVIAFSDYSQSAVVGAFEP